MEELKKYFIKISGSVVLLLLLLNNTNVCVAQLNRNSCGPSQIDRDAINKIIKYEQLNGSRLLSATPYLIRVYFHILQYDNGTHPAIDKSQLYFELQELRNDYSSANICFFNAGFDYINNTQLDTNFTAWVDPWSLFDSYQVPGCINIFYLNNIKGNNTGCNPACGFGGITGFVPGTYCLVAKDYVGGHTASHEVGHCLGLVHTFQCNNGCENINGSNAATAGDEIADTPADPWAYEGNSCWDTLSSSCQYLGSCSDPLGNKSFTPPYHNIMSYWRCSPESFTSGQFQRVFGTLFLNTAVNQCSSPSTVTLGPLYLVSSGYDMESAITTLSNNGVASYSGSAVATLGGAVVDLLPGFQAVPNSAGSVLIRPSNCTYAPRLDNPDDSFLAEENLFNVSLHPNPSRDNVVISYILKTNSTISIEILNLSGQLVQVVKHDVREEQGWKTVELNTGAWSSGIYLCRISDGIKYMYSKMVIAK